MAPLSIRRFRRAGRFILAPSLLLLGACQGGGYQLVRSSDPDVMTQLLEGQEVLAGSVEALSTRDHERWAATLDLFRQQEEARLQERAEMLAMLCELQPRGRPKPAACGGSAEGAPAEAGILPPAKLVVGREELVLLPEVSSTVQAVIDTGTAMTYLDAREIVAFERNGKEWVRFKLYDSKKGSLVDWESRLLHWRPGGQDAQRKPVVEMLITLGTVTQTAEVVLADRSDTAYPMLVGRNVLQDLMLVDVGKVNATEPQPPEASFGGYALP